MPKWKCLSLKLYLLLLILLYIILLIFTTKISSTNKPTIYFDSSETNELKDVAESNENFHKREDLEEYAFQSKLEKCLGSRKISNSNFKEIVTDFYVVSAFYDNRTKPMIRLLTLNKMTVTPDLSCLFDYNDKQYESKITYYELCENHRRTFGGNILSCIIPDEISVEGIPCEVKVSKIGETLNTFEVNYLNDRHGRGKFGVCIPPLFNDFQSSKFVEFIELNKILGVQQFFIYFTEKYQKNLAKVLKYYHQKKIVKLIPWKLPDSTINRVWYHGQTLAIHDCLYRFMNSVEYLIFQDLDEFIIPTTEDKLSSLLLNFKHRDIGGLCFECFYLKQSDYGNDDNLWTLTYTKRTLKGTRNLSKCLVKSDKILEMGIHHISKFIRNTSIVINVPNGQGKLFHLRKCKDMFGDICYKNIEETIINDKYGSELKKNVAYQFEKIGLVN